MRQRTPRWRASALLQAGAFMAILGTLLNAAETEVPLIPPEEQISDFDARRAMAQSLAHLQDRREEARSLYRSLVNERPDLADLRLEYAGLEASLSHAALCREQVEAALHMGLPPDREVDAADLMNLWGAFQRAGSLYLKHLAAKPQDCAVQLKLAQLLLSSQRYEEAEGLYHRILEQTPDDPTALRGLVELKLEEKDFVAANALADDLVAHFPKDGNAQLLRARTALQLGRKDTSREVAEQLRVDADLQVPALLLLGHVAEQEGRDGEASAFYVEATKLAPTHIEAAFLAAGPERLEPAFVDGLCTNTRQPADLYAWATRYAETRQDTQAERLLETALIQDAAFYPARLAQAGLLARTHRYEEALPLYDALLSEFPDSTRIRLERARTLGWSQRFDESLDAYAELHKLDPADPVPVRERARVAAWAKKFSLSRELYRSLCEPPVEQAQDEGRYLLQQRARLEGEAKEHLWNNHFLKACERYAELIRLEPGNEEARFDLAQANASLGLRPEARVAYQELLKVDPQHSRAPRALECLDLQDKPAVSFRYSYWQEEGPGRLADLVRHRGTATVEVPIADRHRLYFEEGLSGEASPKTTKGEYVFNLTGLAWTGQLDAQWSLSAGYRLKTCLDDNLPDVHEARAGVSWLIRDEIRLDLGYDRLDEAHNEIAMAQGITSDNLRVELESHPLRKLEVGGMARFTWYSDGNRGELYEGRAGYSITDHPREFKVTLQGQARGTAEASIFSPQNLNDFDIRHPYWTPRGYAAGQLAFEWRHDLTREQFTGNLTHHYRLRVALGDDSDRNRSIQIDGGWHWDFTERWSLDVMGMWYHSEAWKARSTQMNMRFRF